MLTNRRSFKIKPGRLDEAAKLCKDTAVTLAKEFGPEKVRPTRVLSAIYGPFDLLVLEVDCDSVDDVEKYWEAVFTQPAMEKFFESWDNSLNAGGGTNELWQVH